MSSRMPDNPDRLLDGESHVLDGNGDESRTGSPPELIWTPEMVQRFWSYERTRPELFFSFWASAVLVRHFRKYLMGRVVDYGAGSGFLMDDLLNAKIHCAGVEFGDAATKILFNQLNGRAGFLGVRESNNLSDWNESFDTAFLVEIAQLCYDDAVNKCLASIRPMLVPGGFLILTTPNDEDRSKSFICAPETGRLFHARQHVRSWSAKTLPNYLEKHGFHCVDVGITDFSASYRALRRTASLPIRLARGAAKAILRRRLHLYGVFKRAD